MTYVGCCVPMTEKYAKHWCSMLSDSQGVFSSCHSEISPDSYMEVSLTATAFLWAVPAPVSKTHFFFVILLPNRTACMTAVIVREVRIACVLQSPPMSMPVQLQAFRLVAGGTLSVVSGGELKCFRSQVVFHLVVKLNKLARKYIVVQAH